MTVVVLERASVIQNKTPKLREMDSLSRAVTFKKQFSLPSEKGSTLKGKNLLPNSFLYEDFFSEGSKQTRSHKNCLLSKMLENLPSISIPLMTYSSEDSRAV